MKIILVDGYNVIHASSSLRALLSKSVYKAQAKLVEMICSHCSLQNIKACIVFDAYRGEGAERKEEVSPLVSVVYTGKGKTADSFIESFIAKHKSNYSLIYVITSDLAEGMTVLDERIIPVSPKNFLKEVKTSLNFISKSYSPRAKPFVYHLISGDVLKRIREEKLSKDKRKS